MRNLVDHSHTNPRSFRFQNLVIEMHPEVYEPAEDSFLLLESLTIHSWDSVLELGTGCGLIALSCASKGAQVVCTDINPFAVQLTRRNIHRNLQHLLGPIEVRQGDLFSAVKNQERFHVIVFNPPYLPTKRKEKLGGWFDTATDGGRSGLNVTQRFLNGVSAHLLPGGSAYFVFSSLSDRLTVERHLKKQRLSSCIVASYGFEGEQLDVYHITPTA